jgi:hypothetical protein
MSPSSTPTVNSSEPTLVEWRRLYEAALTYKAIAPWTWLTSEDWFAVQEPETGEIYYCMVLGSTTPVKGIKAHPGSAGYAAMHAIAEQAYTDVEDMAFGSHAVMLSFGARDELTVRERALLRDLGYRLRGSEAWPVIRSCLVGYHPWPLTAQEARAFTVVLEQTIELANEIRDNVGLLHAAGPQHVLTRMIRPDTGEWVNGWTALPKNPPSMLYVPSFDEVRTARLRKALPQRGVWGIETRYASFAIQAHRGQRPIHPPVMLCMDLSSGTVLHDTIAADPDGWQEIADAFVDMVESVRRRPQTVVVRTPRAHRLFQPVTAALGIELVLNPECRPLSDAWQEFVQRMGD